MYILLMHIDFSLPEKNVVADVSSVLPSIVSAKPAIWLA